MDYNNLLNKLFEEWEQVSENEGYYDFCRDGLMQKGPFSETTDGALKGTRGKGNEDELWHKSEKKILFLMKDTNNNPNEDYREWIGRQNEPYITHKFFKNIALMLHGLMSIKQDGTYPNFSTAFKSLTKTFDEVPFAIINCKKESGKGRISNSELLNYTSKFGKYLQRQIEILKPNIIACGGGSNTILNIAKEIIYPDLTFDKKDTHGWIYYNTAKNIILINSFHPSAHISSERMYSGLMRGYQEFLINKV